MSLIDEMKTDMEAHPLDRNPAVMARACERITSLERELQEMALQSLSDSGQMLAQIEELQRQLFERGPQIPAGWQPIETAPKDGSVILVGFAPHWRMDGSRRVYEARWNTNGDRLTSVNGFLIFDSATHWMPLPAAPQSEVKP